MLLLVAVALPVLFGASPVHAQSEESETETTTSVEAENPNENEFVYEAPEGSSLIKLIRQATLTYDIHNDDVSLTPAHVVYIETQIALDMNCRMINVGERIAIPEASIAQYATVAQNMSDTERAAWEAYVPQVDLTLSGIAPVSAPYGETVASIAANNDTNGNSLGDSDTSGTDDGQVGDDAARTEDDGTSQDNAEADPLDQLGAVDTDIEDGAAWYWWLIGAASVVVLWYLLWRRSDDETSSE